MGTIRVLFTFTTVLLLFFASCFQPTQAAPPPIQRQMEIINATIEGGGSATIDPAACYDTSSGELIMNIYETLVFFDGEHMDKYLPQLADNWTVENITGTTSPDGLPWYFRYTFHIRPNVHFWNGDPLAPLDVEYCFERGMVLEPGYNPQWMFYEPLLNTWGALGLNTTALDGNSTEQARVGAIIDHSVESNGTHVWFNLAFPGAYAPLMQILSSPWSGICSKAWALSLSRPTNWDGDWADWYSHWQPELPPFDDPTPVAMGTGPFVFEELNNNLMQWSLLRNHDYWRGWPLDWPGFGSSKPAGYIEHYVVTWAYDWTARSTKFLNGEVDICAVPRQYKDSMIGQPGIRCIYPLPSLSVDALLYQFNINATSPNCPILPAGTLSESGVPSDFFGNTTYGAYIRKAFSHCIDFDLYIQTVFLGEAVQPTTTILPSLPYYNASIPKYTYDLAKATEYFQMWPGLWETGFTLKLVVNIGMGRMTLLEMIANTVNGLNPKFHCSVLGLSWADYMAASSNRQLPAFILGWLADYPDPHNFAYRHYHSNGYCPGIQGYSNPTMDALIDQGIATANDPARASIYSQIQQLVIDDCPSVALDTSIGRHFEQTWVCGWYCNPAYLPGVYAGNLWKWYYTPHAQLNTVTNATANLLPHDFNYDGKTNMVDIGMAASSFGAAYGPPIGARWVYRCDFNNDRKIDMKDIGLVAKNFGKKILGAT